WSEVIGYSGSRFASRARYHKAIAAWDLPELAATLTDAGGLRTTRGLHEQVAMFLSILSNEGARLDRAFLEALIVDARAAGARLLEAEAIRASGLAVNEPAQLDAAAAIFERCGAAPFAARTRCEAAIMRGDRAQLEAGLGYLESIRDDVQVEHYLHAAAGIA